jgi:hypothetical protein
LIKDLLEAGAKIGRKAPPLETMGSVAKTKLDGLRDCGFVMFDHLVGTPEFAKIQADLKKRIEGEMKFECPCLAQSRIDQQKHADLIEKSFRVPASELVRYGLTFERSDIESYEDLVERFKPSTLKLLMPDNHDYFSLWLDPLILSVIEGYMGFRPVLREAYVRRNFPCSYKVMNHNWHRDTNHQHHLLKAFIFFNDCYVDTGAHRYIARSVDSPLFRDKIYYSDEEIVAVFPDGSDEHIISEVPAGTIILEDTRGLHKAGIPQRHYRDLGFAVFVPPMLFRDDSEYFAISKSVHASLMPAQQAYIGRSNIIG